MLCGNICIGHRDLTQRLIVTNCEGIVFNCGIPSGNQILNIN